MNLVQVLALAISFTALAAALCLRYLRLRQTAYIYGMVLLGFIGGILFGIGLRLHDILGKWSVNLLFDVILVIFVIYAVSLCADEIRYQRQRAEAEIAATTAADATKATLVGQGLRKSDK